MGSRYGMMPCVSSFHSCISSSRCAQTSHGWRYLYLRSVCTFVSRRCGLGSPFARTRSTLYCSRTRHSTIASMPSRECPHIPGIVVSRKRSRTALYGPRHGISRNPKLGRVCMVSCAVSATARHGPSLVVGLAPVLLVKVRPRLRSLAVRALQ